LRDKGLIAAQIARIANRQFGHVTRHQLLGLGVPPRSITRWVQTGRLIQVHAGVYAVGHQQLTAIAVAMAAVLACGDQAVLSHDSAAALWGVRTWPPLPEVTAPHHRRHNSIKAHRTETLTPKDIRRHRNIRVTSPSRTILDIQAHLTDDQLVRAVNELRLQKHLRATELDRLLTRSKRISNLIDPQQEPTRSTMEDRFLAFCRTHGLPEPKLNVKLFGHEVDALFEQEKVIVELDSWTHHKERQNFESDRERDAVAAEHGYLTVRVTWARMTSQAVREAARLHRTLQGRHRDSA
jgi:very-short-patch-repair endonuclease